MKPLALVPLLVLAVLLGPVLAGLGAVVLTAVEDGGSAFAAALGAPGFWRSVLLSFWLGPATALVSLLAVTLFVAGAAERSWLGAMSAAMKPVLAVPHAAAAFGFAFLVAPSGLLVRLVSPGLTGFERPPDWLVVNDPAGIALFAGLVLKEIPFLFLVTLAALPQAGPERARAAASLGHGRVWGFLTAVFPALYRRIRLPVYAVIAFATAVVDMALVLGPGTPPTLSVRILRWMNDPDIGMRRLAAAAALVQVMVTLAALALWWLGERLVAALGRRAALSGRRLAALDAPLEALGTVLTGGAALVVGAGILVLALWSVAGVWRFPDALPEALTLESWQRQHRNLLSTAARAAVIALAASGIALVLTLACLENEHRHGARFTARALMALYLPLLVPQIAFLGGVSVLLLRLGLDGTLPAVILAHLVFVLPYVFLTLRDPYLSFDTRYLAIGRALGKSDNALFLTVRLPMLLGPVLAAFALGFAVSVAQYLPTLLVGAGRQPTVTTEAVALASGGNRRLIGVYAIVQTALPLAAFALAGLVPALLWRDRRALRPGAAR